MGLDPRIIHEMYRKLYLARKIELALIEVYPTDKVKSPIHTSVGQEAISVGVCQAMQADDVAFGTYRGHALYIAKGGNIPAMVAELYGKADGCGRGKGGSMHLVDVAAGVMGTSAIVAAGISHAVGYALAVKMKRLSKVVVCFFGDGATDEGAFYESINFASLHKLPILFVCENNGYAIYSGEAERSAKGKLYQHARAYGVTSSHIDDGDIEKIYSTSKEMLDSIRAGSGPHFLECKTYRWYDHVGPGEDWNLGYRDEAEVSWWKQHDQIDALGKIMSSSERVNLEKACDEEIRLAFEFADRSPYPSAEELTQHVYA